MFEKRRSDKALAWIKAHQIAGEYHDGSSVEEIIELGSKAIAKRFKTIVVIGDDSSLTALLNSAAGADASNIAFGYVPVVKSSAAANELDLPDYKKALRALSTRKLRTLKLISINTHFFPLNLTLLANGQPVDLNIDGTLKLSLRASTIGLQNNYKQITAVHKPITITATTAVDSIKTTDSSFLEIKKSLDASKSEAPALRINAGSIELSAEQPLQCPLLAKSYKKISVGHKTIEVRMIVAKTAGFKS